MSRVGKKEIPLPKGVEVRQDGEAVVVKGPKGSLRTSLIPGISVNVENNVVKFDRANEEGKTRA
jgi:large subunit ribosomal protein L6